MRFKKVFALLLTGIMSVSAPAFRMQEEELHRCVKLLGEIREKIEPYLKTV